ncbi:MAG: hypothetical protein KIT36_03175 [Alphaproteobacteria bacterium]|nr:hypothetical protein [Alphaproteobacteria bacterium]
MLSAWQPHRHGPDDRLAAWRSPLEDREPVRVVLAIAIITILIWRQLPPLPAGLVDRRSDDGHPPADLARQADGALALSVVAAFNTVRSAAAPATLIRCPAAGRVPKLITLETWAGTIGAEALGREELNREQGR